MNLTPGMVLAKPLYSGTNELLLSKGFALDAKIIERIQQIGVSPVCIEQEGTEDVLIDDLVSESIINDVHASLKEVFEDVLNVSKGYVGKNVEEVVSHVQASGYAIPIAQIKKAVASLIDELLDSMASEWNVLPLKFIQGQQFRHSLDVTLLSLLLGMQYQFRYQELKHLGMGAMLHDLGMTLLPDLANKKRCDFTPEEYQQYRRHPQHGVSLMVNNGADLFIERVCVLQHHEQPDGRGFPDGLVGSHQSPALHKTPQSGEIFRLAEIIHVADAYLNLTTGRLPLMPVSPEDTLTELIRGAPGIYNQHLVAALTQVIICFPKGTHVRIIKNSSDRYVGYHGAVAEPNRKDPHKPLLVLFANRFGEKMKPLQVDFAEEKFMQIKLEV